MLFILNNNFKEIINCSQVLYERPGEIVAQFKFTALLLPSGTHRITGLPFDKSQCKTERTIKDPELNVSNTYIQLKLYSIA